MRLPLSRTSSARRAAAARAGLVGKQVEAQREGVRGLRIGGHPAVGRDVPRDEGGACLVGERGVARASSLRRGPRPSARRAAPSARSRRSRRGSGRCGRRRGPAAAPRGRASRRAGSRCPRAATVPRSRPAGRPRRRALSNCARSTPTSPNRSYSVHGTTVAASPHAAPGRCGVHIVSAGITGTNHGTVPSGSCSAARSRSHPVSIPDASKRKDAVGAKTWMSPVQPRRSSRCGQSVGMSTKLPRMPHTTFSCRRFSERVGGGEPAGALEVGVQHARDEVAVGHGGIEVAGPAVDLDVAEAVEGEPRLPLLALGAPGERVAVGRAGIAQRSRVELAVLQHLRRAQRHRRAGRRGRRSRTTPTRFCPKSRRRRPLGVVITATGRPPRCTRTGGPVGATRVAGRGGAAARGPRAVVEVRHATSPAAPRGRRSPRRRRCPTR